MIKRMAYSYPVKLTVVIAAGSLALLVWQVRLRVGGIKRCVAGGKENTKCKKEERE